MVDSGTMNINMNHTKVRLQNR